MKARSGAKTGALIGALDIGTSKITCLIGETDPMSRSGFRFLGGGRQQSRGFNNGAISDMEALERSIRLAVEDAEREAGQRIDSVILGITGAKVTCEFAEAEIDIGGREVISKDKQRVETAAMSPLKSKESEILSVRAISYSLDGQNGIRDAAGMIGDKLGVRVSVMSAPKSLVRNLVECVSRAHLKVVQLIPSAVASAAGAMIEDEVEHGATCIDLGAGVTAISVFLHGGPAWIGLVPVGGSHITGDIAQGVGTTFAAAERVKTMFGAADSSMIGEGERIDVPRLGDDGRLNAAQMQRSDLTAIIGPRVEEIFELVAQRLQSSEIRRSLPRRTVLTGGGSQLPGVREVATRILCQPVRLGRPVDAEILGETHASPVFSSAAGLLSCYVKGYDDASRAGKASPALEGKCRGGVINRILAWLRENF